MEYNFLSPIRAGGDRRGGICNFSIRHTKPDQICVESRFLKADRPGADRFREDSEFRPNDVSASNDLVDFIASLMQCLRQGGPETSRSDDRDPQPLLLHPG